MDGDIVQRKRRVLDAFILLKTMMLFCSNQTACLKVNFFWKWTLKVKVLRTCLCSSGRSPGRWLLRLPPGRQLWSAGSCFPLGSLAWSLLATLIFIPSSGDDTSYFMVFADNLTFFSVCKKHLPVLSISSLSLHFLLKTSSTSVLQLLGQKVFFLLTVKIFKALLL